MMARRYHMLSLQSLLGAGEGWYELGYADLARPLRRHSYRPQEDLTAFFRQAAFNAAIGNTDDHLKNFSLLHDERGWRLTPAYDLLPNIAGSLDHVLSFGPAFGLPTRAELMALGRHIGLAREQQRRCSQRFWLPWPIGAVISLITMCRNRTVSGLPLISTRACAA